MFRGREVTHPERGTALLDKLAGELAEIAVIEQSPLQDGRNMTMMLAPSKSVLATEKGGHEHEDQPAVEPGVELAANGQSRSRSTRVPTRRLRSRTAPTTLPPDSSSRAERCETPPVCFTGSPICRR